MSWDFLTNSIAPWWATVALPIVTLLVGQRFTSKAAREQRADEIQAAADLRRDEAANKAAEREHERAAEEEDRRAAAIAAEEARFNGLFDTALDTIHALQAEIAAFIPTGKLNDDALRLFAVALGHLRVHITQELTPHSRAVLSAGLVDQLNTEWVVREVVQLRVASSYVGQRIDQGPPLVERLSQLAESILKLRQEAVWLRAGS